MYENTEELVYEYKFKREGLAVAPYEIIFDKEVLQDLCLGYAWILKAEEGFELGRYIRTDNKKIRKIRRYDHYKTAGYEEDPYSKKGRIKARINSESSSKTEDVENYKENFFLFGINAYNQRSNIFKNRISTEMIISDSNQFKRIIENLASVPIQIDSAGEIGWNWTFEDLGEKFEEFLWGKFEEEGIHEFNNWWVQMKLGMFALLKKNFEGSLDAPIFDKYWDFSYLGSETHIINVEDGSDEEKQILNKTGIKHNSSATLHRVQNFCINLWFKSLEYYYKIEKKHNFKIDKQMIYFEGENAYEDAWNFSKITDMSYLMTQILKKKIVAFDKDISIKKLEKGVILLLSHLNFLKNSNLSDESTGKINL